MDFNLVEIGTVSMVLFAVVDIFGSIPMIIEIKQRVGKINALRATLVSLVIMVAFLIVGEKILNIIGIGINAFAVAGSFILFFMAFEMILGIKLFKEEQHQEKTATIVPLAFPIIAGAGTMTSLVSLRAEFYLINILIAIFLNMVLVYIVLKLTGKIEKLLGSGGIAVLRKIFGIILLAIAVKLFSSNAKELFN